MRKHALTGRTSSIRRALAPALAAALLCTTQANAQAPISPPRAQHGGQFGFAVAAIPDVNGNGRWDFAVGAQNETHGGRPNGGRVHIYNGYNGGRLLTIAPPFRQTLGSFGWSVSGMPDVNGDGRGEVIIGAPWEATLQGAISGRAYMYSARNGQIIRAWVSPWGNEFGGFGWSTASVPDINGDGITDVLIGAPFETHPNRGEKSGRAYAFCGRTGIFIRAYLSPIGQANGGFGLAVAGIQDLDGDGRGEVVIAAPHESVPGRPAGAGRVYVLSGRTGQRLRVMGSPNQQANGRYGFSLAVGDVTGDGVQDIIVGAPYETPSGLPTEAGRAYIYNGATGKGVRHLTSTAPRAQGHFGISAAVMNDINADGRNDVAIGAEGDYPIYAPSGAGLVYAFSGTNYSLIRTYRSRTPQLNGRFGAAIAALPDIAGNGRGELLVGAHQEDNDGDKPLSGGAYLFR